MRRFLDSLYDIAAVLAAIFSVVLFLTVLLTIASRELHWGLTGIDGYAGYFMAACAFLALAHTFKRNEHIRVTLFLGLAKGRARFWIELWALAASSLLSVLLAYFSLRLTWQSYVFKDISTSMDATPLWIPQTAMALGAVLFAVAVLDALLCHLRGKPFVTSAATQEFSHD